ncbi:MAG: dihydropteroate synthase [Myxococcales bacterium]
MAELWGVVNVTPDSFSDGGKYLRAEAAIEHGRALLREGADVLDVGGESSRPAGRTYGPGFTSVPVEEEIRRIVPVIEVLAGELGARVSVDTVKPEVASSAFAAGAQIINDVQCGRDPRLAEAAARAGAEYVLMHNRGRGEVEAPNTRYHDVVQDVLDELLTAAEGVERVGVPRTAIWLDPGLGFAKTARHSAKLLSSLGAFTNSGYRVLVGPSRKSFLAELAPDADGALPSADHRVGGTAAAVAICVAAGVDAVRVHDVYVMRQALRVAEILSPFVGARP